MTRVEDTMDEEKEPPPLCWARMWTAIPARVSPAIYSTIFTFSFHHGLMRTCCNNPFYFSPRNNTDDVNIIVYLRKRRFPYGNFEFCRRMYVIQLRSVNI